MRETGIYQAIRGIRHFVPHPLPPSEPPLKLNSELATLYGEASFSLGQLNEMSLWLPDSERFIKAYVIKEGLLSSAIEGIHTTLLEAFTQPIGKAKPSKETQLVLNYTKALHGAREMLKNKGSLLSSQMILRAHEILMSTEREEVLPGRYREQPVRVGNLIPPPSSEVPSLMSGLEKFINEPSELPPLIRAGLVHVQFETIHPFSDGNGRIGRLLIVLMLLNSGLLHLPILYPSYYFKKHRLEYYQRLDGVRQQGDFEGWISYYLKAIRDSARDAYQRAKEIEGLELAIHRAVQAHASLSRMGEVPLQVLDFLFMKPVAGVSEISEALEKSDNTIRKVIAHFIEAGWVVDDPSRKSHKTYRFDAYLTLLEKEYS